VALVSQNRSYVNSGIGVSTKAVYVALNDGAMVLVPPETHDLIQQPPPVPVARLFATLLAPRP
jgi:hypothetical protein